MNVCFQCLFLHQLKWHDDGSAAASAALSVFVFVFVFSPIVLTVTPPVGLDQIAVNPLNPFLGPGLAAGKAFSLGIHGRAAVESVPVLSSG